MPEFPKPAFEYDYQVSAQLAALRVWRDTEPGRAIPSKSANRLLVATWNIANLGAQDRRDKDHELIAEILGWFDISALQEVRDDLTGIRGICKHLPASYRLLFSDASGNDERLTFLYDAGKVTLLEEVGEVSVPPSDYRFVKLPGIVQAFDGFDRNPYLALFRAGSLTFSLINVHSYFGKERQLVSMNRRSLETYAIARWADLRRQSKYALTTDIVPLGDFNMPKADPGDPIFDALTKRGLQLPPHSTKIASNIRDDANYDQVAFFPGDTRDDFTGGIGVFDFDGAVFRHLWDTRGRTDFLSYVQYYISDHRPLWAEFQI